MQKISVTAGALTAGSANAIALSQTPTAALTLNGSLVTAGIVYLLTPRRVLITTTGNESANFFTITGTNQSGNKISEVLAGANAGTSQSVLDYFTVTSIVAKSAAAAALTVGTNGVGGSPWVRLDSWANSFIAVQCVVSGTVNYTVQQTLDDPNDPSFPVSPALMTWINNSDPVVVNSTTSQQTNYVFTPVYVRIVINSGTGTVTTTLSQSGVVGR
jgi:hypothetical protein